MSDQFIDDPTLRDPDGDGDETKYKWDEEFQRHIISLILLDRQFLLQSMDLIKPNYFTNKVHQKACSIAFSFFKKQRTLINKIFLVQEIKNHLKDDKSLPYYLGEINVIFDYFQPGLDARDYLMEKITYFAKMQAFCVAFKEGLKLLDENPESEENWQKIYDKIETVMTTTTNFEIGLDYFKTIKDRYVEKPEEVQSLRFITGLDGVDERIGGGGYIVGEVISVIGGSGVGKSVFLACMAKVNVLRGKKCVYITLELGDEPIANRLDAIFTGFNVRCLKDHKDVIYETLTNYEIDYTSSPMIIKQFPAGQASVNTIKAYLSQLRFHGFNPDFVIVDYVGEMADLPNIPTYESREKIVRGLRALATEEKIFIATAMQPNRDGNKTKGGEQSRHRIDDNHLADSYGQIRPLDGCFSLNQNENEKNLGIGRFYVIKQRNGDSRYEIKLKFDQENLRITEISTDQYKMTLSAHIERTNEGVMYDKVNEIVNQPIKPKKPFKPDEE